MAFAAPLAKHLPVLRAATSQLLFHQTTQSASAAAAALGIAFRRLMSSSGAASVYSGLTHLRVSKPAPFVLHVQLCRPDKLNSMTWAFFDEVGRCFATIGEDPDCRVAVISAEGKHFTAGLDLADAAQLLGNANPDLDAARRAAEIRRTLSRLQANITALERCSKPILAAVHGGCIGGGVDLVSAADVRYCSADAFFSVKEVDLGLAADLGSLQRLPKTFHNASLLAELTFTGRRLPSEEALRAGFVSRVLPNRDALLAATFELAGLIASKSPVAVQTAKRTLLFARDHPVAEGLEQIAAENAAMLQSEDVAKAVAASITKEAPEFAKL